MSGATGDNQRNNYLDFEWPVQRYVAHVSEESIGRARAALARGDVLMAYDEAAHAVDKDPSDLEAGFVAALALARSGATTRARGAALELLDRVEGSRTVPVSLREDAEALVARLAKDDALAIAGRNRCEQLLRAAELYEAVARRFGGYYSCINAATLFLLSGEADRARAAARRVQRLLDADGNEVTADEYWREATRAEAFLILGDEERATSAIRRAARLAGHDFAALAVTRRQLRLLCEATHTDDAVLGPLEPPLVLHYCGRRADSDACSDRFSPSEESATTEQVRGFLTSRQVGFGYGSLASGADIIVAEALLDRSAELHVVLPFASDDFDRVSVAPAGHTWSDRFSVCLKRASSVVFASDSSYMGDDELFGYAACIAMGHALNHATLFLLLWAQYLTESRKSCGAIRGATRLQPC
jgi:hypothetical protein